MPVHSSHSTPDPSIKTRPRLVISRRIFDESIAALSPHFDIIHNQDDALLNVFEKVKNKRTVQGKLYWVNDGTPPETFMDKRQIYVDIGRI